MPLPAVRHVADQAGLAERLSWWERVDFGIVPPTAAQGVSSRAPSASSRTMASRVGSLSAKQHVGEHQVAGLGMREPRAGNHSRFQNS